MKTLIVEDSATLCVIYSHYLDGSGLEVTAVETLAAAREMLVELSPQLILLDIELPDGNGLDLMDDVSGYCSAARGRCDDRPRRRLCRAGN